MGILWFGGPIYTMDNEGDAAEAVYTEGEFIKAVGTYERLYHDFFDQIDNEVNLKGKMMLPGLVDSHMHIIQHGEKLLRLDLSQMISAEEVKEALKNRTANLSDGEWLVGEGWNENQWEDPVIFSKAELDDISPDNPMILSRVCRHALLANSKAMQLSKIAEDTPNPQGGIIVRDKEGKAAGYFLDTAQELIKAAMPEVSQEYLQQVINIAVDDLLAKGLVGGHSEDLNYYGGFNKTYQAFMHAVNGTKKKFKAHLLVHHEVLDDMLEENMGFLDGTTYVELGAVKLFSDGALGGRTAWLSNDYSDDEGNTGVAIHSRENLENIVQKARKYDLPIAVHAIGDQAADEIISVMKKYPLQNGARDRLIHGQLLNERSLKTLTEIPVIVDIQPSFVASDFPWVIGRIGNDRLKLSYAWKTMMENGVICAGGSDAPIEGANPLLGIQAAVLRKSSFDGKVYLPGQKLSVFEAVRLYTVGSAQAISQENFRGLIKEGYTADFTILEDDIFQMDPEMLDQVEVAMTVVDGDIVYEKNPYRL
ncbi:amidohydrolase [Virgibacillus ihumii]|uniref:amidohydrolase n=1 Tax=Virgibacillus ihumii TaxID=2686091 RepID=UPI00157DB2EF|nr:amidohydrolase [Virgibacillus ihumii]